MTGREKVRRRVGDVAYVLGLLAVAAVVAVVIGVVVRQSAELETAIAEQRALARQVERLGGTPVVTPPPPGAKGERGERGEPGIGIEGPRGRPPSAGELLAAATQALAANPPPRGEDGSDGRDGIDGEDGEDGADGESIRGETGEKGEKGDRGEPGPSCPDGWHQEAVTVLTPTGTRETTTCVRDEES